MCGHMPLTDNHLFPSSRTDAAFKTWHSKGLVFFSDLFLDGTFASFEALQQDHELPKEHFFRYLQVRSFAREHFQFPTISVKSILDTMLGWYPYTEGSISDIHMVIQEIRPPLLDKTKSAWERDLNIELDEETWERSLERIHTTSLCLRHCLIQFKILHRLHFSREKLSRIYPNFDSTCVRCHLEPATVGHMFWGCTSLAPFWRSIFDAFSSICHTTLDPNPITAILWCSYYICHLSSGQLYSIFLTYSPETYSPTLEIRQTSNFHELGQGCVILYSIGKAQVHQIQVPTQI